MIFLGMFMARNPANMIWRLNMYPTLAPPPHSHYIMYHVQSWASAFYYFIKTHICHINAIEIIRMLAKIRRSKAGRVWMVKIWIATQIITLVLEGEARILHLGAFVCLSVRAHIKRKYKSDRCEHFTRGWGQSWLGPPRNWSISDQYWPKEQSTSNFLSSDISLISVVHALSKSARGRKFKRECIRSFQGIFF